MADLEFVFEGMSMLSEGLAPPPVLADLTGCPWGCWHRTARLLLLMPAFEGK